jgi:hypothetical protein
MVMFADNQPDRESTRRVTFSDGELTIMVNVEANRDGTVRLDGWLAPGCRYGVEMHYGASVVTTTSDEAGRFVLQSVPHGLARLVVRRHDSPERTVTTPIVEM